MPQKTLRDKIKERIVSLGIPEDTFYLVDRYSSGINVVSLTYKGQVRRFIIKEDE